MSKITKEELKELQEQEQKKQLLMLFGLRGVWQTLTELIIVLSRLALCPSSMFLQCFLLGVDATLHCPGLEAQSCHCMTLDIGHKI